MSEPGRGSLQARVRVFPYRRKTRARHITFCWCIKRRDAAQMVAVEAPYDMHLIPDTEGVGELTDGAVRQPAFYLMRIIAQQAHEARVVALDVAAVVHRQAHDAAAPQEAAQRGVDAGLAQAEQRKVRIEQVEPGLRPRQDRVQLALELGPGVEAQDLHRTVCAGQASSSQPSEYQV